MGVPEGVVQLLADIEHVCGEREHDDAGYAGVDELGQDRQTVVMLTNFSPEFF
jgi:hypothetical protein